MRHRHFTIVLAIAWAMTVSTGGCAAKTASCATQPTALAVPATQPAALDVPFVYSSYFEPERLNEAQRHEINTIIAEAVPKVGQPWFVYVRYSRDGTYRVSAYFRSTGPQGAVRRGQVVYIDNDMPVDQRRQIVKQLGGPDWPAPQAYVQVPAQDSDQTAIPAESDLPFSPPDGMSDDELVKVVRLARAAAMDDDLNAAGMPVRNIQVRKDGAVRVYFGWQAGGLNGRGVFVELKRDGGSFAAPSVGMWVS